MNAHQFDLRSWRRKAGLAGLAAALLALGGCVTCPDDSVGNVCYATSQGQYGTGYYAPAQPHYGGGYYAPAPTYYGSRYYQRPYYPY